MSADDVTRLGGIGEVAEDEASGAVSVAYEQLRLVLGVPFVPTVYRMAATHERIFVKALGRLAPFLTLQRELDFSRVTQRVARQALGSPLHDRYAITLDMRTSLLLERYATANPLGLLFVLGLLGTGIVERSNVMSPPLPARSADLYTDILQCHGGAIVPGFWRELGTRPELLEVAWSATREQAEQGGFDAARRAVVDIGIETVRQGGICPRPNEISSEELRQLQQLLGWFPTGIATMIAEIEWLKVQSHFRSPTS